MTAPAIAWQWSTFAGLAAADLYAVLHLRQTVFVLEQACLFPDIDWHDQAAMHLLGWMAADSTDAREQGQERSLAAYLRCLPPGQKYVECAIGRVVTAGAVRGAGIGRLLVAEGLRRTETLYPGQPVRIGAQRQLEGFYGSFGFGTVSAPYVEDDIMHVEMLRTARGGDA